MNRIAMLLAVVISSMVCCPWNSLADDAAIEAREGEIDHWIEYYNKERGTDVPIPPRERDASGAESGSEAQSHSDEAIRASDGGNQPLER